MGKYRAIFQSFNEGIPSFHLSLSINPGSRKQNLPGKTTCKTKYLWVRFISPNMSWSLYPIGCWWENWLSPQTHAARPQQSLLISSGYSRHCYQYTHIDSSKADLQSLQPYTNSLNSSFRPAALSLFQHISLIWVISPPLSQEGVTTTSSPWWCHILAFGVRTSQIFTGVYNIPAHHLSEWLSEGGIQKMAATAFHSSLRNAQSLPYYWHCGNFSSFCPWRPYKCFLVDEVWKIICVSWNNQSKLFL